MSGNNIIQKQIVEVEINLPGVTAFESQAITTKWCNEVLIPTINKKLEKYALIEDVIRLEKISIDISENMELLTDSLAEKIAAEIEILIKNKTGSGSINTSNIPKQKSTIEAFLFFLQNAYLPWWSNLHSISEMNAEDLTMLKTNDLMLLKELLFDPSIRKRFVNSVSPHFSGIILSLIFKKERHEIEICQEKIRKLSLLLNDKDLQFQFIIWANQIYINTLLNDVNEISVIKIWIEQLINQYKIKEEIIRTEIKNNYIIEIDEIEKLLTFIKMAKSENKLHQLNESQKSKFNNLKSIEQKDYQKKEGIYISNAGLVIFAPFLPRFFENLGIIEKGRFNSQDLALALLQFLVTGNDGYEESDLVLPKILCGMEPEEAVIIIPSLPESFKKESDNLLQSVIQHWEILKNTSVNGFRESFLQRDGKLSKINSDWRLQVEQKPFDMLLEHLPWNINKIKLSWMQGVLSTEWVG